MVADQNNIFHTNTSIETKDAVCLIKWLLSKKEDKTSPRKIL